MTGPPPHPPPPSPLPPVLTGHVSSLLPYSHLHGGRARPLDVPPELPSEMERAPAGEAASRGGPDSNSTGGGPDDSVGSRGGAIVPPPPTVPTGHAASLAPY